MSAISDAINNNNNNIENTVSNGYKNKYFGTRLPLKASRKESITLLKREDRTSPDSSVSPEATPIHCSFCPSVLNEEQQISEHLQVSHKVLNPTRCPLCEVFVRDLAPHIALQHPQQHHQQQIGGKPSAENNSLLQVSSTCSVESVDLSKSYRRNSMSPNTRGRDELPDDITMNNSRNRFDRSPLPSADSSPPSPSQQQQQQQQQQQLQQNFLLRTTTEMLRAASNSNSSSSNSSSPILSLVRSRNASNNNNNNNNGVANDNHLSLPMNLSVRNEEKNNNMFDAGKTVARLLNGSSNKLLYEHPNHVLPISDGDSTSDMSDMSLARKRRKQTHVPDSNKDDRYWARRMKNNEAAKRSRDMRIRREKVVFEENAKLEHQNNELKSDIERLATDNKELHLKMDIILEENTRLKSLLLSYQAREEAQRKRLSAEFESNNPQNFRKGDPTHADNKRRRSRCSVEDHDEKPFPFPEGGHHQHH